MQKKLFSTPELAEWLGVFHSTVRRWIERGRIRGVRVGRNYKIPADEAVRILNAHGIPLPYALKNRGLQRRSQGGDEFFRRPRGESILKKLIAIEDIDAPALICRNASILVANRAFAKLVGIGQTDLIGVDVGAVMDEMSRDKLLQLIVRRSWTPSNGYDEIPVSLKTSGAGSKKDRMTISALNRQSDLFVAIVKST